MSLKESATIDVGYPIMATKFLSNKTILVAGGGGEGNNGISNKIIAIKCSFKINDAKRRLQKFREITLPSNEDSPQCLDTCKLIDEHEFNVVIGCNQSSQLIKTMNINNNIRKYIYTTDEHLRFNDAAQFEQEITDFEEYPKLIKLSSDNSLGCFMTSKVPSVIYIFNPETLELKFKYSCKNEIKDLSIQNKQACLLSSNSIELISLETNNLISVKKFDNFVFSRIKSISAKEVLITGSLKGKNGAHLFIYNVDSQKITKSQLISKQFTNIVALDISINQNLIAVASNNLTVALLNLSTFKTIRTFKKLHPFAITSISFSPNGLKLATGSAANTLHVFKLPANLQRGKSIIGTLFQYLLTIILVCVLGIGIQQLNEAGKLNELAIYSKEFSEIGYKYGKIGMDLCEKYGKQGVLLAEEYFKEYSAKGLEMYNEKFNQKSETLNDIVSEVTKNIDSLTINHDFESSTFFKDKKNYITSIVASDTTTSIESTSLESSTIDTNAVSTASSESSLISETVQETTNQSMIVESVEVPTFQETTLTNNATESKVPSIDFKNRESVSEKEETSDEEEEVIIEEIEELEESESTNHESVTSETTEESITGEVPEDQTSGDEVEEIEVEEIEELDAEPPTAEFFFNSGDDTVEKESTIPGQTSIIENEVDLPEPSHVQDFPQSESTIEETEASPAPIAEPESVSSESVDLESVDAQPTPIPMVSGKSISHTTDTSSVLSEGSIQVEEPRSTLEIDEKNLVHEENSSETSSTETELNSTRFDSAISNFEKEPSLNIKQSDSSDFNENVSDKLNISIEEPVIDSTTEAPSFSISLPEEIRIPTSTIPSSSSSSPPSSSPSSSSPSSSSLSSSSLSSSSLSSSLSLSSSSSTAESKKPKKTVTKKVTKTVKKPKPTPTSQIEKDEL